MNHDTNNILTIIGCLRLAESEGRHYDVWLLLEQLKKDMSAAMSKPLRETKEDHTMNTAYTYDTQACVRASHKNTRCCAEQLAHVFGIPAADIRKILEYQANMKKNTRFPIE